MSHHDTDLVDGLVIAQCPNECQHWELEIEHSAKRIEDIVLEEAIPGGFMECSTCGGDMDYIIQEEQTEVLD